MTQVGELGVQIAGTNEVMDDTTAALAEDEKFFLELEKDSDTKTKVWGEVKKTSSLELLALADTIKVFNEEAVPHYVTKGSCAQANPILKEGIYHDAENAGRGACRRQEGRSPL